MWKVNRFSMGKVAAFIGAFGLLAGSAMASTVKVDLNDEHQVIRGFGGMVHNTWQGGAGLSDEDAALAYGTGEGHIGLNTLRIPVNENQNDWNKELNAAKSAKKYAGKDFILYATPWKPPQNLQSAATWKRYDGKIFNTCTVAEKDWQAYVNHLNSFAAHMKSEGVPLYAISVQNEPDYAEQWATWSADQLYKFVKQYGDQLRKNGTKVITGESFAYAKNYYDQILNDDAALKNIDILGAHFYSSVASTSNSFFQYSLADKKNVERWMTEHYTESNNSANLWRSIAITGDQDIQAHLDTVRAMDVAYEIHRALVEGNFNQYTWWYVKRSYGLIMGDNVASIPKDQVGKITKRGYLMSQYSRFVRPGAIRVGADKNPESNLFVSAFKNADSVIVVMVNRDWGKTKTVEISVPGIADGATWTKYVTSETKNAKNEGEVSMSNGKVTVTMDKESVMTLVAANAFGPPVPREPFHGEPIAIPGKIQAEDFDIQGTGAANKTYNDKDSENHACSGNDVSECSEYRKDTGVDIYEKPFGTVIGYNQTGEWLEYTVNVKKTGDYTMFAYVASQNGTASFKMSMDGVAITSDIVAPATVTGDGQFDSFGKVQANVKLTEGKHILRFEVTSDWLDVDYFTFVEGENAEDPEPDVIEDPADDQDSSTVAISKVHFELSGVKSYSVFDMNGNFLGKIQAAGKAELKGSVADLVKNKGSYLVKTAGQSIMVNIAK